MFLRRLLRLGLPLSPVGPQIGLKGNSESQE